MSDLWIFLVKLGKKSPFLKSLAAIIMINKQCYYLRMLNLFYDMDVGWSLEFKNSLEKYDPSFSKNPKKDTFF